MAEMGFVGKLRGDCSTEQVLSPGLVSLEEKHLKRGIGGGCGWGILCQYHISVIIWR